MSTKIKLGNRPKSFKHVVKFKMLDGQEGLIPLEYKYRTRTEFGALIDKIMAEAEEVIRKDAEEVNEDAKEKVKKFSMKELMEKTAGSNADYIMDVVDSWELDADLTRENVQQLCDELPAAAAKLMEDYQVACKEGRLGN